MDYQLKYTDGRRQNVGNIYGIGRNYDKHAKEMGAAAPAEPIIFIKPSTAYLPNNSVLELPEISENVHHEVELVVVIGSHCRNIEPKDAISYIAGYAVGIDFTLRDVQARAKEKGLPWAVAKGFAGSAAISRVMPTLSFPDGIPYVDLGLVVNKEQRQQGNTKDMLFSVSQLISYLSKIFILEAGDCIFTGTPEGVGSVKPGDKLIASMNTNLTLELEIG